MTTTTRTRPGCLFYLLAAIILTVIFRQQGVTMAASTQVKSAYADTVKKKYRYFYRSEYDLNNFGQRIDTIYNTMQLIGKAMTVDDADYYKALIERQLAYFIQSAKYDSVEVKK